MVLHVGTQRSILPELLTGRGPLAIHPKDRQLLRRCIIYVAPPDRHMLFTEGTIGLTRGPRGAPRSIRCFAPPRWPGASGRLASY